MIGTPAADTAVTCNPAQLPKCDPHLLEIRFPIAVVSPLSPDTSACTKALPGSAAASPLLLQPRLVPRLAFLPLLPAARLPRPVPMFGSTPACSPTLREKFKTLCLEWNVVQRLTKHWGSLRWGRMGYGHRIRRTLAQPVCTCHALSGCSVRLFRCRALSQPRVLKSPARPPQMG